MNVVVKRPVPALRNTFPVDNEIYKRRPVYNLYPASESGKFIHTKIKFSIRGRKEKKMDICVVQLIRPIDGKQKRYYVHRFVWECYNGLLPDNILIDHINDMRDVNRLNM